MVMMLMMVVMMMMMLVLVKNDNDDDRGQNMIMMMMKAKMMIRRLKQQWLYLHNSVKLRKTVKVKDVFLKLFLVNPNRTPLSLEQPRLETKPLK